MLLKGVVEDIEYRTQAQVEISVTTTKTVDFCGPSASAGATGPPKVLAIHGQ
jgi:hypothetical protein